MTFEQWWSEYAIQNEISKELLPAFKAVAKDAWEKSGRNSFPYQKTTRHTLEATGTRPK